MFRMFATCSDASQNYSSQHFQIYPNTCGLLRALFGTLFCGSQKGGPFLPKHVVEDDEDDEEAWDEDDEDRSGYGDDGGEDDTAAAVFFLLKKKPCAQKTSFAGGLAL